MAKAMKKSGVSGEHKPGGSSIKKFEERLQRLEELGEKIRRTDIPLDEALGAFEEGIKLARTLENELERVESRIEILMNNTEVLPEESPELELFDIGD